MEPFFHFRETLARGFERKRTLILFAILFVGFAVLGGCFCKSPAFYDYHRNAAARFVDRVCYSDTSVAVLFFKRTLSHALLLVLVLAGGIHPAALFLPSAVLIYRAYTFGGGIVALLSVYKAGGALIAFVLYLPVHLIIDALLLLAFAISCGRAASFCFCKEDFGSLLSDLLVLTVMIAAVCLLEAILLLALFHPIGNLL